MSLKNLFFGVCEVSFFSRLLLKRLLLPGEFRLAYSMAYFNTVLNTTICNHLTGVYVKSWQHISVVHLTIISPGIKNVYFMGSHIVYKICSNNVLIKMSK
jgi:hypothetical protein